jgi:hypothetical protein
LYGVGVLWTYDIATKDFGPAIVTASDRMLTDIDLGIEYQGSRYKGTVLGKQHMILVSGDVTIHSAMLLQLAPALAASQAITNAGDGGALCRLHARIPDEGGRASVSLAVEFG